ncbi:GNAT family protein [Kosakonia sp.]|uniref:GNAT family N-acetyltransferase n=1 Tax=Kosakonia sp. TaxID=1916651 RepID=UPI0028977B04|nr:GNAT family protein [Kosakonia sp.]
MIVTTTSRLILRAFNEKDALPLLDYLSSPRTPCFQDEKLNSFAEARAEAIKRSGDSSQFAVCLKDNDHLIGHLFADNRDEPDTNTWSVGWHFNSRYEGQGLATESVSALFHVLFTQQKARRLYAYVEDYNLASQKLCERLHMRREGCFKEFVSFVNEEGIERFDDTFIYALLRKEWNARSGV